MVISNIPVNLIFNDIKEEFDIFNEEDQSNEKFNQNKENNLLTSVECYNFNNITDMSYMFSECVSLISLPDISKWNTSNVTEMDDIFVGCINCLNIISKFVKKKDYFI